MPFSQFAKLLRDGYMNAAAEELATLEQMFGKLQSHVPLLAALRGELLRRLGDFAASATAVGQAFQLTADESPARLLLLLNDGATALAAQNLDEAESLLRDARDLARRLGLEGCEADALSNLAVTANIRGRDEEAIELWRLAGGLYESSGNPAKYTDCLHALGTVERQRGNDDPSVALLKFALNRALALDDAGAVERIGGDLARTYHVRNQPGDARLGLDALEHAWSAEDALWNRLGVSSDMIRARGERVRATMNNLETGVRLLLKSELLLEAFGLIQDAKGRIAREDSGRRRSERMLEYQKSFGASSDDELSEASVLPLALKTLSDGRRTAFIDHFAMSAGDLFICVHISVAGNEETLTGISKWPGPLAPSDVARKMGGDGQGAEAREALDTLLKELERYPKVASYFVKSTDPNDVSDDAYDAIKADAEALTPTLMLLGQWLFPSFVRDALALHEIEHVVLSPDPRVSALPWLALQSSEGAELVSERWTLSLLPSLGAMIDIRARRNSKTTGNDRLTILAPDQEVNQHLGGEDEFASAMNTFSDAQVHTGGDATLARLHAASTDSSWIHLRGHGDMSAFGWYTPELADGLWTHPFNALAHPVLVAICCRVGQGGTEGYDLRGLTELAERSDFGALVAPIVGIDGIVAARWAAYFYEDIRLGRTIAQATRSASELLRKVLPHPAYWAVFNCSGDPFRTRLQAP